MLDIATEAPPLRDYQQACVEAVCSSKEPAIYYTLPTGCGKTRILTELVSQREQHGRILAVAHRKELVWQLQDALRQGTSANYCGVIMANERVMSEQTTASCIASLTPDRLAAYLAASDEPIGTILIDEAHHATRNNRYMALVRDIRAHSPDVLAVGCTATPFRADKERMQDTLPVCVFARSIPDMQAAGVLCDLEWHRLEVASLNLGKVGIGQVDGEKDFKRADLELAVNTPGVNRSIVDLTLPFIEARPAVVFAAGVKHAQELAEEYQRRGAEFYAIWGDMPASDRRDILRMWRAGDIQGVVNCAILGEGFDYPAISCVVQAAPTMSPNKLMQQVGRGTRIHPGKADCRILDICGNANLVGDARPLTLLDFIPYEEEERDEPNVKRLRAKAKKKDAPGGPPRSLRVNDPFSRSWVSFGFASASSTYYADIGNHALVVVTPVPSGSGLYHVVVTQPSLDLLERATERPLPIEEAFQHVNLLIARMGVRKLADKDASWRNKAATGPQLNMLRGMAARTHYPLGDTSNWTAGQASLGIAYQRLIQSWRPIQREVAG